jgi:hypothetical protein
MRLSHVFDNNRKTSKTRVLLIIPTENVHKKNTWEIVYNNLDERKKKKEKLSGGVYYYDKNNFFFF